MQTQDNLSIMYHFLSKFQQSFGMIQSKSKFLYEVSFEIFLYGLKFFSGGSRISPRGGRRPRRWRWTPEGVTFRKICMPKWKNLDAWGGVRQACPLDPPMVHKLLLTFCSNCTQQKLLIFNVLQWDFSQKLVIMEGWKIPDKIRYLNFVSCSKNRFIWQNTLYKLLVWPFHVTKFVRRPTSSDLSSVDCVSSHLFSS